MNQIGDLFIGKEYAIYAPMRNVLLDLGDMIVFDDMSSANLATGEYENKSLGLEFTIVKLIDGENHFTFGKANENPKNVAGQVTTIDIDYPGVVQIIPSDSETSFQENRLCFGSVTGSTLTISRAVIKEITYFHTKTNTITFTGMSVGANTSDLVPVLQIHAPKNINITGACKAISFVEMADIDISASIISGNKAKSLTVDQAHILDVPYIQESYIVNASGKVLVFNQLQCKDINISTTSKVRFYKPVHSNSITINTTSKIIFQNLFCSTAQLTSTSTISIDHGMVKSLHLVKCVGKLIARFLSCDNVVVETVGKVFLEVETGTTTAVIQNVDKVNLVLDVAGEISVNNVSGTETTANEYLAEPDLHSVSKNIVNIR